MLAVDSGECRTATSRAECTCKGLGGRSHSWLGTLCLRVSQAQARILGQDNASAAFENLGLLGKICPLQGLSGLPG